MKTVAIILFGGSGSRMGVNIPKQFIEIDGQMIAEMTISKFNELDFVDEIILSAIDGYDDIFNSLKQKFDKVKKIVRGGETRQKSVYNALKEAEGAEIVIIHDGARPLVTTDEIKNVVEFSKKYGSAITALDVSDTIKTKNEGFVQKTLNRDELVAVKTPQAFKYDLILRAHNEAISDNFTGTDDAQLIENLGKKVYIVKANDNNIKITTNIDLIILKSLLKGDL